MADFDGDGFLDLLVANYDQPPALLKNTGNANRWLQVRLVGTRSNRDGIGARLTLSAGGREQTRAVLSGTSFLSQHSLVAHFGLGQLRVRRVADDRLAERNDPDAAWRGRQPAADRGRASLTDSARALLACALLLAGCASSDPASLYRRWIEYGNRADVEGQVRLLADDATLSGWSYCLTPCPAGMPRSVGSSTATRSCTTRARRSTFRSPAIGSSRAESCARTGRGGPGSSASSCATTSDRERPIAAAEMLMDLRDPPTATYLEFMRAEGGFRTPEDFRAAP